MTLKHSLITAYNGLKAHKSRSALTILGIVIGITAIILMMSIGEGAQNLILNQIRGLGSRTISIEPGREPSGPSDFADFLTDSLKEKDIEALKNPANVPNLSAVAPVVFQPAIVSRGTDTVRTNVLGTSESIAKIFEIFPDEGNFFTDEDVKQKSSVAVIGSETKKSLFGSSQALGENIKIKDKTFRVIGVIAPKGQLGFLNVDKLVAIPYSTAQKYILGINYFNEIAAQADDEKNLAKTVEDIKLTLRESHDITDPSKDDFHIITPESAAQRAGVVTGILTTLLVSIAAISLVVGGIGIMNIMLVSVTERTREIGLRKALGASGKDILTQFLLEAVMLTALGGIFGILLGALLSFGASLALAKFVSPDWTFSFPVSAAIIGLVVSSAIGLAFGLYPARKASRKSPIEALRYE